jgi:hypothetical protein
MSVLQTAPCRKELRRKAVRRPEELGRARDWLETLRQGTQNLVDSYTEMDPEALEVLPSVIRNRI